MNKYTICICDDELAVRQQLKNYILCYSFEKDAEIQIIELDSAEELLTFKSSYDILFLDILFEGRNIGIDIAQRLRAEGNTSVIIIASALRSMLIEGYRAEPFRFILKPFTKEDVLTVLNDCIAKLNRTVRFIKITCDSHSETMRADKILYISSNRRKRTILCSNSDTLITWQTLSELMNDLPPDKFVYSHKSYIVNLDMIDSVKDENVILIDQSTIPLSLHYKDAFMKALLKNWES